MKSYSPVSHPSAKGYFDLVVKGYPYREGHGFGSFLCDLKVEDTVVSSDDNETSTTSSSMILAELKGPRKVHGDPTVYNRWKYVGLVAGGTGIAPLFQLARIMLDEEGGVDMNSCAETTGTCSANENQEEAKQTEEAPTRSTTTDKVHLLFINKKEEDILMKDEIDALAKKHPDRFLVTYSLTEEEEKDDSDYQYGRGSAQMALDSLPPPANGDGSTMVFVCGRDGFVESWGGAVGREATTDGSKGKKIQGPLKGWLSEAGYQASEVFKY